MEPWRHYWSPLTTELKKKIVTPLMFLTDNLQPPFVRKLEVIWPDVRVLPRRSLWMMNHQAVTHSVCYLCRYRAARAAKKDNCEPRLRILCPTSGHGLFDNIHAVFKLLKGWSSQTARLLRMIMEMMSTVRVAEVPQSRDGPSPKSLDSHKTLKP